MDNNKNKQENDVEKTTGTKPIQWKLVLGTGAVLGVIDFLLVALYPGNIQLFAPISMLLAIYYLTPKLTSRRFISVFVSSSIAGWLGWLSLLVFHPTILVIGTTKPTWSEILVNAAIQFIPVWFMFSILMSWFNIWVSDRSIKRREKQEAERKAKVKAEREAQKPALGVRRKKKKWKKKK